ncbi:MAG: hypothetical protein Q4C47_04580 [Planctomycetia bacterium]|nr:hypothetical protein [Planctomycetia bacterium]
MRSGFGDLWGWFRRHWRLAFRYADAGGRHRVETGQVCVMSARAAQLSVRQAEAAQCVS